MTPGLTMRWLWTSSCVAALLGSGCAHWGWKHAGRENLDEVTKGEASFTETPLAKPLHNPPAKSDVTATKSVTRSAEDEALIDDTLARLRTLPDMKPEQVDEIARCLRNPSQPMPRMLLQQMNAHAKFKQEQAAKQAAAADPKAPEVAAEKTATVAATESTKPPAIAQATAIEKLEKPAPSEPPAVEETDADSTNSKTTKPVRLLDRVRRAREATESQKDEGIFGGKVGANVAPKLEPELLAFAHVTKKPATLEETPADEALSWDSHLAEAIAGLEDELEQDELDPAEATRRAAQLRLLYLVAERKDEALREISGLDAHEQDYWRNQLHSLSVSLSTEGTPVKGRRAALALRPLRDAVDGLAAQATLDVKNVALCKSVTIWGNYTEFDEYTFKPNQEVLLYFEVENFASAETSQGYATEFVSSYEIFDAAGRRVAEQQFPTAQETCKNRRRDYFIRYHLHVPKALAAGDYTLQLTVEDQKGHKFGQGSVKFKVSG